MSIFAFDVNEFKQALSNNDQNYLNYLLKYLFDPVKNLPNLEFDNDDNELIRCVTGGLQYEEFKENIKKYDTRNVCGQILKDSDYGFRCGTCAFVEGVLFCVDCFKNGDHFNHDYAISRYCESATCDCGSDEVMPNSAFCNKHAKVQSANMPDGLINYCEFIVPHLIYRMLQYFRSEELTEAVMNVTVGDKNEDLFKYYDTLLESIDNFMSVLLPHFKLLFDLCTSNESIRKAIIKSLLNVEFYQQKLADDSKVYNKDPQISYSFKRTQDKLQQRLDTIKYPPGLDCSVLNEKVKVFRHMLDEFIFWTIYLRTPDSMATFLYNLLFDESSKEAFFESFLSKYFLLDNSGCLFTNNRIGVVYSQMCFQFFFNRKFCEKALEYSNYLESMILHFYNGFQRQNLLKKDEIQCADTNKNMVLNFSSSLVYVIVFDMLNLYYVFNHPNVCLKFISNDLLFSIWIDLIYYLQGMRLHMNGVNKVRKFYTFDSEQIEASTLWRVVCLNEPYGSLDLLVKVLNKISENLFKWFDCIGTRGGISPNKDELTFDLQLHRYYSIFLFKALHKENGSLEQLLTTDQTQLLDLLGHPLQIQIACHKINASLWTSVGDSLIKQKEQYFKNRLCTASIDVDLFLINCLFSALDVNTSVSTLFQRFEITEFFQEMIDFDREVDFRKEKYDDSQKSSLVYSLLVFISEIVSREVNLDSYERDCVKQEIIQLLCFDEYTYKNIEDKLYHLFSTPLQKVKLEEFLVDLADLKQPDYSVTSKLKEAKYTIKGNFWETSYDPLYYNHYRSDKDNSEIVFNRYCNYVRTQKLFPNPDKLWPPFRLPSSNMANSKCKARFKILNSKILHSLFFVLLYRRLRSNTSDEKIFQLVIYLIEMAIEMRQYGDKDRRYFEVSRSGSEFDKWFASNDILDNLCDTISFIEIGYKTQLNNENECNGETTTKGNVEKTTIIEESMISILLKILHKDLLDSKIKNKMNNKFVFDDDIKTSRIGDEFYFIKNLLNKAAKHSDKCKSKIEEAMRLVFKDVNTRETIPSEEKSEINELNKTRKMKILKNIAKQQQDFAQRTQMATDPENQTYDENDEDDPNAYYCCICRSSSYGSLTHPIGLISLVMNTNMVGFYDCSSEPHQFVDEGSFNERKLWFKENKRFELLNEAFTSESCKYSVNTGFKDGVYVRTCGHYVHTDCHKEMMRIKRYDLIFDCPLCRQPANCLLSIKNPSISKYLRVSSTEEQNNMKEDSSEFIRKTYTDKYIMSLEFVEQILEIDNETLGVLHTYAPEQYDEYEVTLNAPLHFNNSDSYLLFSSILRVELEVNYLHPKSIKYSKSNRLCFKALLDILSTRCSFLCVDTKPHIYAWNALTKPVDIADGIKPKVPMLLRDPVTILLQLVLNWPIKLTRLTYKRFVISVFNLVYAQNMLTVVFKMSTDVRDKLLTISNNELKSFNDYLRFIVSSLPTIISTDQTNKQLNNVESNIEELCLPYLRIAALFQAYLFGEEPDDMETFNEFTNYLHISYAKNDEDGALLNWFESNPKELLKSWFFELTNSFNKRKDQVERLLSLNQRIYYSPKFVQLPDTYLDLFYEYLDKKCEMCKEKVPLNDCICLFCGKYITQCCLNTTHRHKAECYGDYGVYFFIFSTNVNIVYSHINATWGSLYLDAFGGEDIDLKRGQPLYLSHERYALLKRIWYSGGIQFLS